MKHPVTKDNCLPAQDLVNHLLDFFMNYDATNHFLVPTLGDNLTIVDKEGKEIGLIDFKHGDLVIWEA